MKKLLLLILFSVTLFLSAKTTNSGKAILLKKIPPSLIKIDGVIDEAWNGADSAQIEFQMQPFFGKVPARKTVAKVVTDDEALYCLIKSYDDIKDIQKNTGLFDQAEGDVVSIMIDTFNDKKTAYRFAVNAAGVKNDSRLLDDARNRDQNWDGIWFADSKIYDWGFATEIKIPYKSIKYDNRLTTWGIDFDRWNPKRSEDLYWCEYEENEGMRVSKFGNLLFDNFNPSSEGLNLEIYPVGITKAVYKEDNSYDLSADAGIDVFFNPSPKLTYQLTANPDFAQIEADPYDFNISRYESYFNERRPFFTEGNEIFMASGKQRSSGFYRPLELFYSRRIGEKLPDGKEVPLIFGTKAFGRIGNWEYGGFLATTAETDYMEEDDDENLVNKTEPRAYFSSARLRRNILGNSTIGFLFVGKHTADHNYGVFDIDGAFRGSSWQLSYQIARSFQDSEGDFAGSAGYMFSGDKWINFIRGRYIGKEFDIDQVGYVPWIGTGSITHIAGPRWYFNKGAISQILIYGGYSGEYNYEDEYLDKSLVLGFNMQLRSNWGYEINLSAGKSKDEDVKYNSYEATLSSWFHVSPVWEGNLWAGYSKTYNFSREFLAYYSWVGGQINWRAAKILQLGTSADVWVEGNPEGGVEDVTYNARPYFSLTPINNLNLNLYVDNVFTKSADRFDRVILGFLLSYNFAPKSWIYFAINEVRERTEYLDQYRMERPMRMQTTDRAGALKIKYLYYF